MFDFIANAFIPPKYVMSELEYMFFLFVIVSLESEKDSNNKFGYSFS